MPLLVQFRKGREADLPRLDIGEPALTTDTNKVLIGTGSGNMVVATISEKAIEDLWDNTESSMRLSGGIISDNGDGTVAITAGAGLSKDAPANLGDIPPSLNTGQGATVSVIGWAALPTFTLLNNSINYVYYHKYSNSIVATDDLTTIDEVKDFIIGKVYRTDSQVTILNSGHDGFNYKKRQLIYNEEVNGLEATRGSFIVTSNNLNILHTPGTLWVNGNRRYTIPAFNSGAANRFTTWYRDYPTGWVQTPNQAEISNTHYDNATGLLEALTTNRYGVHWIYLLHDGTVHIVYGQQDYTLLQAQRSEEPDALPGLLESFGVLIARIIIGVNSETISIIDSNLATIPTYKEAYDTANNPSLNLFTKEIILIQPNRDYEVVHNLNTLNIMVYIRDTYTKDIIDTGITITDANTINLHVKDRLGVSSITVVILG